MKSVTKNLKELSDSSKRDTSYAAARSTPTPQETVHQITNTSAKSPYSATVVAKRTLHSSLRVQGHCMQQMWKGSPSTEGLPQALHKVLGQFTIFRMIKQMNINC